MWIGAGGGARVMRFNPSSRCKHASNINIDGFSVAKCKFRDWEHCLNWNL